MEDQDEKILKSSEQKVEKIKEENTTEKKKSVKEKK